MKQTLTLLALAAMASCSPAEPPPMAAPPKKPVSPAPAPAPAPKTPAPPPQEPPAPPPTKPVDPPSPLSEPPQPKPLEDRRPPPAPPAVPRAQGLAGTIHLPSFTFRSLAGAAQVQINGESYGLAPCLWTVTDALEFDPKIPVGTWPPERAFKIGTTRHPENGSADLWLDASDDVRSRFPHLRPDEAVIYVDGTLGGKTVRGGLRLLVEGFKYAVYTPLVDPEGEEASRYLRTIWFDRKRNE